MAAPSAVVEVIAFLIYDILCSFRFDVLGEDGEPGVCFIEL